MTGRLLEVCAFTLESCLTAEAVGAARVELCDNPLEGGTTPAYGFIKQVMERVNINVFPIVRPRAGNFCYSSDEYQIMKYDIQACRELGCAGISIGAQKLDGTIDLDWMKRIVDWAGPMQVTCHRVFDTTPDPFQAMEDLIACGCTRILTSGQQASAPEGSALLGKLIVQSAGRITIMPGAGVKSTNLAQLMSDCGALEYHTSARIALPNKLNYINPEVSDYGQVYVADEKELRAIMTIINSQAS